MHVIFSSCVSHCHRRHTSIVSKTGNPLGIAAPLFNHEMIMFAHHVWEGDSALRHEIVASTAVFASYIERRVGVIHLLGRIPLDRQTKSFSNTTAVTAMPSRRPTNPSPSVVVALMLIWF